MITLWLYKSVEIVATWLCLQTFQTFLLVLFLKDFFFSLLCAFLKVVGSVGHPIRHIEFKVVDSETSEVLPTGLSGILKVRGPPVMKGYYKVSIIFIVHIPTCVPIYMCMCVYLYTYLCLFVYMETSIVLKFNLHLLGYTWSANRVRNVGGEIYLRNLIVIVFIFRISFELNSYSLNLLFSTIQIQHTLPLPNYMFCDLFVHVRTRIQELQSTFWMMMVG